MTKVLTLNEVIRITTLSRSSIYRMMTEKSFPRNVNLNERAVVWVEKEIDDWLKKRIKERR